MLVPPLPNLILRSRLDLCGLFHRPLIARSARLRRRTPLCHFLRLPRRSRRPPFLLTLSASWCLPCRHLRLPWSTLLRLPPRLARPRSRLPLVLRSSLFRPAGFRVRGAGSRRRVATLQRRPILPFLPASSA